MQSLTRTDCRPCDHGVLDRPRYYARQIITATDLTLEQRYHRDKLRRHNLYMHGYGCVCGAQVCPAIDAKTREPIPWRVSVRPGYLLGPFGDEILIDCERTVNLRTGGVESRCGDPAGELEDPRCAPTTVERDPGKPLYVAVRYKEFSTRPVRVQPNGCGCNENPCENSRLCDGYELAVMTKCCPDTHQASESNPSLNYLLDHGLDTFVPAPVPECPPCPDSPWLYLAEVRVDSSGKVTNIDNCACRRMVLSFAKSWWECCRPNIDCESVVVVLKVPDGVEAWPGPLQLDLDHHVSVSGCGIGRDARVTFEPDVVRVTNLQVAEDGSRLEFDATLERLPVDAMALVESGAQTTITLVISDRDCQEFRCPVEYSSDALR